MVREAVAKGLNSPLTRNFLSISTVSAFTVCKLTKKIVNFVSIGPSIGNL